MKRALVSGVAIFTSVFVTFALAQTETKGRTMNVCVASPIEDCGSGEFKLACGTIVQDHAKSFCTKYGDNSSVAPFQLNTLSQVSGGRCGITRYSITCKAQPWPSDASKRTVFGACISDGSVSCSPGVAGSIEKVSCGTASTTYARSKCGWSDGSVGTHYIRPVTNTGGGQCGATLVEVTCIND